MGMRLFCDHCGNTIQRPNKFQIRPVKSYDHDEDVDDEDDEDVIQTKRSRNTKVVPKPFAVDLCDHCMPVWFERVKALTKASDVPTKKT